MKNTNYVIFMQLLWVTRIHYNINDIYNIIC